METLYRGRQHNCEPVQFFLQWSDVISGVASEEVNAADDRVFESLDTKIENRSGQTKEKVIN